MAEDSARLFIPEATEAVLPTCTSSAGAHAPEALRLMPQCEAIYEL